MKAADLEALALRVEREEPSQELYLALAPAVGFTVIGDGSLQIWPQWLHSLDAAASLVPPGWIVADLYQYGPPEVIEWWCWLKGTSVKKEVGTARDEPRARTAAALRAMAQEAKDD